MTPKPVVARGLETTVAHGCAQGLREVMVAHNDEDATLEGLNGLNEGSKRLMIKAIDRLTLPSKIRTEAS